MIRILLNIKLYLLSHSMFDLKGLLGYQKFNHGWLNLHLQLFFKIPFYKKMTALSHIPTFVHEKKNFLP